MTSLLSEDIGGTGYDEYAIAAPESRPAGRPRCAQRACLLEGEGARGAARGLEESGTGASVRAPSLASAKLADGADVGREDPRILRSQIASGAENRALAKARCRPLLEEGAAFPGAGNSAEPLGFCQRWPALH